MADFSIKGFIGFLFIIIFIILIPLNFINQEEAFRDKMSIFKEATSAGVIECASSESDPISTSLHSLKECIAYSGPVHMSSDNVSGTVADDAFGVKLDKALILLRSTEYCQWEEKATERCKSCSHGTDADGNEQYYDCDCVTHYSYDLGWHSQPIKSRGFNQARSHVNPQFDPYPSTKVFALDARLGNVKINPKVHKSRNRYQECAPCT